MRGSGEIWIVQPQTSSYRNKFHSSKQQRDQFQHVDPLAEPAAVSVLWRYAAVGFPLGPSRLFFQLFPEDFDVVFVGGVAFETEARGFLVVQGHVGPGGHCSPSGVFVGPEPSLLGDVHAVRAEFDLPAAEDGVQLQVGVVVDDEVVAVGVVVAVPHAEVGDVRVVEGVLVIADALADRVAVRVVVDGELVADAARGVEEAAAELFEHGVGIDVVPCVLSL